MSSTSTLLMTSDCGSVRALPRSMNTAQISLYIKVCNHSEMLTALSICKA